PKGVSVTCTNLVFGFIDNEDGLEMFSLLEGHLVMLFISPPARLIRVEHNTPLAKARVEVEENVSLVRFATGKVHPEPGRKRGKEKRNIKREVEATNCIETTASPGQGTCSPKGASVTCTNLVSEIMDNKDDLELLAFLEGIHVFLFLSPPAILKCAEANCLRINVRPEAEGNIIPLMLATGKLYLEVHPGSGRERKRQAEN
ncbi:hypothetical protein E2320_000788, partial [Naja naja]